MRNEPRRSVNRSTILYMLGHTWYMFVQHEECRHDGLQQYHYTKSNVPVRDRTLYRGVHGRTVRASGRTRGAAGRHTWYGHECKHSYNCSIPRCTRSYSMKECMQVRVRTTIYKRVRGRTARGVHARRSAAVPIHLEYCSRTKSRSYITKACTQVRVCTTVYWGERGRTARGV